MDILLISGFLFVFGAVFAGVAIYQDKLKGIFMELAVNGGLSILFFIGFLNLLTMMNVMISPKYYADILVVFFFAMIGLHTIFGSSPEAKMRGSM